MLPDLSDRPALIGQHDLQTMQIIPGTYMRKLLFILCDLSPLSPLPSPVIRLQDIHTY